MSKPDVALAQRIHEAIAGPLAEILGHFDGDAEFLLFIAHPDLPHGALIATNAAHRGEAIVTAIRSTLERAPALIDGRPLQ